MGTGVRSAAAVLAVTVALGAAFALPGCCPATSVAGG